MSYNEIYMHAQNDPAWSKEPLGHSGLTIGSHGCFASCITYLWSRKTRIDHDIPDFVAAVNRINGFNAEGLLSWDAAKKVSGLTIQLQRPWIAPYFTMRNVTVQSKTGNFSHWVVELSGGQMYCPLKCGGHFVHDINFHPPVFNSNRQINRRFVR